jgi:hypothetical protein
MLDVADFSGRDVFLKDLEYGPRKCLGVSLLVIAEGRRDMREKVLLSTFLDRLPTG